MVVFSPNNRLGYFILVFSLCVTGCYGEGKLSPNKERSLPLIIAHRGASYDAPENTLQAFQLAWEQEADGIEGDFFLTKDKEIVCFHDANTKRITGVDLMVEDATLDELQALDVGGWKGQEFVGIKMPTLQDVIQTVPKGKKIIIELKSDEVIVPYLCKILEDSDLDVDQIVVLSFNKSAIQRLEEVAPYYKTTWAVAFTKRLFGRVVPSPDQVLRTQRAMNCDGISTGRLYIPQGFSQKLASKGIAHHVWTVNDLAEAQTFLELQSITTDIPEVLVKGLKY